MLGRAVARAAQEADHGVVGTGHSACAIEDAAQVFTLIEQHRPSVIINCVGSLPFSDPLDMIAANTLGPHVLASTGLRLVHMSTDCVFSGKHRPDGLPWLTPHDRPDPVDLYGRTKLAGEPESALVVRGSFIGAEGGFLHWLVNATGQVDAWTRALWNGLTADGMANVLVHLASGKRVGVVHVASPNAMSKAAMVNYFVEALSLPVKSIRYVDEPRIDRRLEPDPDIKIQPLPQSLEKLVEELCPVSA